MAVVKEWNIDGATVWVCDDYIRSREESEEIMERVTDLFMRQLYAQHIAKQQKEHNKQPATDKTA